MKKQTAMDVSTFNEEVKGRLKPAGERPVLTTVVNTYKEYRKKWEICNGRRN